MKVILIQGCPNAGKSSLFWEIHKNYVTSDNTEVEEIHNQKDFLGVYHIKEKKVLLNSWADTLGVITGFREFYHKNKAEGYDVLVTAIRSLSNSKLHKYVKEVYQSDCVEEFVIDLDKIGKKQSSQQIFEEYFIPIFS